MTTTEILEDLPRKLRSLRAQLGLSRSEIETRTEVSAATLKDWENGKLGPRGPGLFDLLRLARFYRVSTDWLFGLSSCENVA